MRVFITGGAGFIGSHLAEALLARGDQAVVLDDLSTGQMSNLDRLAGRPGFAYRIGSVMDRPLITEMMDDCDVVVHLAAAVGVRLIVEQPVHTIHTNVHGTETVLQAAAIKRKLVVVASTSEVYGKSSRIPFGEEDDLQLGPTMHSRWAYACSKALDEWLALAYWNEKRLPVIVPRFFNTVGPRQTGRYGMVLPNFAGSAVRGDPIRVFGDGNQSRCFAHVRDVVRALIALVETPAAVGQVVNIGTDREVTILRLAEMVRAAAGSDSPIRFVPYSEAYPPGFEDLSRRMPDVSRLERLTGMRPTTSLEEIIADVVEDQRTRLQIDRAMRPAFAATVAVA